MPLWKRAFMEACVHTNMLLNKIWKVCAVHTHLCSTCAMEQASLQSKHAFMKRVMQHYATRIYADMYSYAILRNHVYLSKHVLTCLIMQPCIFRWSCNFLGDHALLCDPAFLCNQAFYVILGISADTTSLCDQLCLGNPGLGWSGNHVWSRSFMHSSIFMRL